MYGTGIGLCCPYGIASGFRGTCAGKPVIAGKGGDLSKVVSLNASLRYCSSFGTLWSVAGYSRLGGFGGIVGLVTVLKDDFAAGVVLAAFMISGCDGMGCRKHDGMMLISIQPALLRYMVIDFVADENIWIVLFEPFSNLTGSILWHLSNVDYVQSMCFQILFLSVKQNGQVLGN